MNKEVLRIVTKEDPEIIRGLLLDLVQMDKRNEERLLLVYLKY